MTLEATEDLEIYEQRWKVALALCALFAMVSSAAVRVVDPQAAMSSRVLAGLLLGVVAPAGLVHAYHLVHDPVRPYLVLTSEGFTAGGAMGFGFVAWEDVVQLDLVCFTVVGPKLGIFGRVRDPGPLRAAMRPPFRWIAALDPWTHFSLSSVALPISGRELHDLMHTRWEASQSRAMLEA